MTATRAERVPAPPPSAPTSAVSLLDAVRPFGVAVVGDELAYSPDLPAELAAAVRVLHTGLRALLTGRKWIGCGSTARTAAPAVLNPVASVPPGVTLLCVEGDTRWDRIGPVARVELPRLFDPAPGPSARG